MNFFFISYKQNNLRMCDMLEKSCQKRKIKFCHVDPSTFDYLNYKGPKPGDLLYRSSTGQSKEKVARTVERFLLAPKVNTFYSSYERSLSSHPSSFIIHSKMNVPIPKTIWHIPKNHGYLLKYIDYLGGFPVIIKAIGGSHGVGVMKIDSLSSLLSVIDFIKKNHSQAIMRQLITTNSSARLIVVGDCVVSSIEYLAQAGDFRTNVGIPKVIPKKYDSNINKIAINAVRSVGIEFGGVDILINHSGQPYVTEVNFPCNFGRAQKITGDDISGRMVDHLAAKANA